MLMENEGKTQHFLKMPYYFKEAFGNGKGYLGEETGRKIIEWINTGEKEDPEVTRIKSEMLMACEFGLAGVIAIWNTLSKDMKKKLEAHKNMCKEAAEEYERQAKEAEQTPQDGLRERQAEGQQQKIELP